MKAFAINTARSMARGATLAAMCMMPLFANAQALNEVGPQARGLDVNEHLNAPLPMSLMFTDQDGKRVTLGEYFAKEGNKGKPAVVGLVYFSCPIICNTLISTVVDAAAGMDTLKPGDDYNVLMFSFDERDSAPAAEAKRHAAIEQFPEKLRENAKQGLKFHVTDAGTSRQLANAFGFQYRKLEESGEFAHPVVFFVVTPEGRISRYVYGFGHTSLQLKLAILEAGEGKIVPSLKDRILTFCYMYDPKIGAYTIRAVRVMQLAGLTTLVGLGGLIGVMLVGERLRRRAGMQTQTVVMGVDGGSGGGAETKQPEVSRANG